jgi:hypothetical protein
MTIKEKILRVMNKLPESASIDEAIYRLEFLQSIEQGAKEPDQGLVIDHDELFSQLLSDDAESKASEILTVFHGSRLLREEDLEGT